MTRLIRPARPTDLPQLARMTQQDAAWLRYLAAKQKRSRWQLLVAEQDGDPVGFLVYEVLRPASAPSRWLQEIAHRLVGFAAAAQSSSLAQPAAVGLIRELFVSADWRRQGLATALVNACLDRLAQVAVAEVQVILATDDQHACQLFVGLGFRPSQYLLERDISDLPGADYVVSRLAEQADLAQLAELMRWEIRYQQRLAQTIQLRPAIDWLRYATAKLRRRDTALLVVEREGRLVGYGEIRVIETGRVGLRQRLIGALSRGSGKARPGERIGFVEDIYILPAFRREGLAEALLADGVRWCQQQQIRIVQGSVWHANRVSLRFFTAAGCVVRQQRLSKILPVGAGEG